MRTLRLTHKEIELINNALDHMYRDRLTHLGRCYELMIDMDTKDILIDQANEYSVLSAQIKNSEKDV